MDVVRATLWFASAHSRLATKQLSAHRITMAAIQDLARVEDVIKAVHDMIPKDQHPYDWLREQVPAEQMPNYFAQLGALMDAAGAKPEWDMMLPVEVFDDPDGADLQVPLTLANFQMMTCVDDGKQMETCWRQHSKIRVMAVVGQKGRKHQHGEAYAGCRQANGRHCGGWFGLCVCSWSGVDKVDGVACSGARVGQIALE